MDAVRRSLWVIAFFAGVPGILVGFVSGYAFFVLPIALGLGFFSANWEIGIRPCQALFAALAIALAFGLGVSFGAHDWWFFSAVGTSAMFALLATFKAGMVVRLRLFRAQSG